MLLFHKMQAIATYESFCSPSDDNERSVRGTNQYMQRKKLCPKVTPGRLLCRLELFTWN
jgi:hypothetical protein